MSRNKHISTEHKVKPKLLDIIIPVYNRFDLLTKCLGSITNAVGGKFEYNIVLVDNASDKDEAREFYEGLDGSHSIIRNGENLGFPKACNQGVRRKSSPLILFLNSDVILWDNSLTYMVEAMDDPKVGVCGMKLLFPEDLGGLQSSNIVKPRGKVQHVGLAMNIRTEVFHIFLGWDADHPKVNAIRNVSMITGAALMTRRFIWNKVGGFLEAYGLGCLTGDTLIYTENGISKLIDLIPIEDGDINETLKEVKIGIASECSNETATLAYINGLQPTLKITTENSFSIQGTLNHKVRAMSDDGNVIWKQLDELKIGDFVGIRYGMNLFGKNHLSSDDAYLFGIYIAEGCYEKSGRITIANKDSEIIQFLIDKYDFSRNGGKEGLRWRKSSVKFCSWLSQYIDLSKKALTKEIPPFILQSDEETQVAFLQGLFDGDGCAIHDGRVTYSSSSDKLINQLQFMLLNFGIVTSITSRQGDIGSVNYLMDFGGHSSKFYSDIGFRLPRKQERMSNVRFNLSSIIPHQREWFRAVYNDLDYKNWKSLGMHNNNPADGVRRETIELLIDHAFKEGKNYSDSNLSHLGEVLLYNCVWKKVRSIEDGGIQNTYDLHIPSNHAYVANGFIVHNTFEDTDYCLGVKQLGYNVIVETKAVGYHYTGASAESNKIQYPMTQNRLLFLQRWQNKFEWDEVNYY